MGTSLNGREKGLTDSVFAIADGEGMKDVTERKKDSLRTKLTNAKVHGQI
jgi:hypothetical protein